MILKHTQYINNNTSTNNMATNNNPNSTEPNSTFSLDDITFLVVDDDRANRRLFQEFLPEHGAKRVITFSDGGDLDSYFNGKKEDLKAGEEYTPEKKYVLITDTDMPGKRGPEIGMEVREKYPEIKIAAMSGRKESQMKWIDVKPDIYFNKADSLSELDARLDDIISFLKFQHDYTVKKN